MAEVGALLEGRGVASTPAPECPSIVAELTVVADGLRVAVRDVAGRQEARVLSDTVTAATFIESRARVDLADPLLGGASPPPTARGVEGEVTLEPAPPARSTPGFAAHGAAHTAWSSDDSAWLEAEAGVCVEPGPLCVGGIGRGRLDWHAAGQSATLDTRRVGVDVLLGAEVAFDVGGVVLRPGAGVGEGWLRSRFTGEEAGRRSLDVDAGGLRLAATLGLGLPLDEGFEVALGLRAQLSPLAHTAPHDEGGVLVAGEPLWGLGAGLGVRYGAP